MMLRELRKQNKMSQKELANKLNVGESTVSMYESGKREMSFETALLVSELFGVTVDYLLRGDVNPIPTGLIPFPDTSEIPIVGRIACGTPITAEENIEGYASCLDNWHANFALICKGNSMAPRIQDGDVVAIRIQPEVENGQIAAVLIDDEATLKHVYHYPDQLVLQPENAAYAPIVLHGEEINSVTIEGLVVGICRGF